MRSAPPATVPAARTWSSGLPRWATMSRPRRAWEAFGGAIVWGLVCGLLLTISGPLYVVGTVIGVLGGVAGGAQHATLRGALQRAAAGGTLFGCWILVGRALTGNDAVIALPDPSVLLVLVTLVPAFPLSWLGWRLVHAPGSERA